VDHSQDQGLALPIPGFRSMPRQARVSGFGFQGSGFRIRGFSGFGLGVWESITQVWGFEGVQVLQGAEGRYKAI